MASIDILLLAPVILGAYNGYKRGLLVEIIGLLALVLAVSFGFRYLGVGMDFIAEFVGSDKLGNLLPYLSFFLIFFPSVYFINKLGWGFRKALRLTFLGILDGLAGAALGAVLWFFGLSVLLWIAAAVGIHIPNKYIAESEIYPFLEGFGPNLIAKMKTFLPSVDELIDRFKNLSEMAK
ncbi:CvpA family protein [Marinilongibacter aquaticus]|uniref:CvpA family protein n=1 Tax=Marinilongibacter aquaticus TaxID=2975157 RepID=UPI0021BDAD5C|nr:CvpA family protein [Marinilongibacter aquaticus]UBM60223.1 CvpA family protein [Marinilongibacter aquaticus]